ncbi:uncharacterized protein JCM6883_003852 [Sporobolomyces salmoneus]|uniref:uncharacterized protein n=1 Tax=Sporobolomyces salmoneus TaxID=183962 RepID=UPI00317B0ADA
MPIPFIPPEIVSEILSHFRLVDEEPLNKDDRDIIEAVGCSTSLVCRSWRALGQAVRWRKVSIKPSSTSSILEHFVTHPRVSDFVRELKTRHPRLDPREDGQEGEQEDCATPSELLSRLAQLKDLSLALSDRDNFEEFIVIGSRLPKLVSFQLIGGRLHITPRMKTALLRGFPTLNALGLQPAELVDSSEAEVEVEDTDEKRRGEHVVSSISSKSQLGSLELAAWFSDAEDPATTMLDILRHAFDLSELQGCSLGGLYLSKEILLDVLHEYNLFNLQLVPVEYEMEELFTMIVDVLPHMTKLALCSVVRNFGGGGDVYESPVVLGEFLDLIPSNLELLMLPQIAFDPDDFNDNFRDAFDLESEGKESVRSFAACVDEDSPLILHEFETESGREWCRASRSEQYCLDEESSREENSDEESSGEERD